MRAFLRGTLLFVPLVLFWRNAGAPWDTLSAVLVGIAMLAGVGFGRPWSSWVSASDWSGMTADPLFDQINQFISALWGFVLIASGVAWWSGGGAAWHWGPSLFGAVVSTLMPPLWVRHRLGQRLTAGDPNPWPSPLVRADSPARASSQRRVTMDVDVDVDVVVVGAGIGGLTAAALLARAGARVAVFEQHDKPGGYCHCWDGMSIEGGRPLTFRFDGGVHDVSGYFDGGTVKNLLQRLDLDDLLSWRRMDHAFVDDNRRWDVPRGWPAFTDALAQRFPSDAARLTSLLSDVQTIFASMYATAPARGGVPGLPATVADMQAFARRHPLAARWMQKSFDEFLDHHGISQPARALLKGLSVYVTHEPGRLTVAEQVPLLGYFLHGGHYPVGGSGALAQALADSIALDGGELHLSCRVRSIDLAPRGEGVEGLQLVDGRRVSARCVVMAGDAIAALSLLQPSIDMPASLREVLESLKPATSMFAVHLGVRGTPPALPPIVHLHRQGHAGLEMVLPSVVDRSAAPPGYFTVVLMRLVEPDEAQGWFDDPTEMDPRGQRDSAAYLMRKSHEADAMIDAAETLIPGIRESIVFRREASPLTFRRYGFSTTGSVYGVTDAQGGAGPVKRRSPVPGLVFAGSAAGGAGIEPAMMSGAQAADALIPGLLANGFGLADCHASSSPRRRAGSSTPARALPQRSTPDAFIERPSSAGRRSPDVADHV